MNNLIVHDKVGNILSKSPGTDCDECVLKKAKCTKGRFSYTKETESFSYTVCFDKVKNQKEAAFLMKHFTDLVNISRNQANSLSESKAKINDIVVHNTRNLLANLNSKIERYYNFDKAMNEEKRYEYLRNNISSNMGSFVREFGNFGRIVVQLLNEYSIIDLLSMSDPFPENARNGYEIHSILMLTYYHYENEFKKNGLFLELQDGEYKVDVEFRSIKTAFSQFYDNLIKYAMPNQNIHVEFQVDNSNLIISFYMKSLYLTDEDIDIMFQQGRRGEYAEKLKYPGDGYGCYIISYLIALNSGSISAKREKNLKITSENSDNVYSHNLFTIKLPLRGK